MSESEYENDVTVPEPRLHELLVSVAELNAISEYLQDPHVDQTLAHIVSLIEDPNKPPHLAGTLVVALTAISVSYHLKAKRYQLLYPLEDLTADEKKQGTIKKNLYYSLSEGAEKLANALKYIARN